jgi:hypothetical protein
MSKNADVEKSIWASWSLWIDAFVAALMSACGAIEVFVLGDTFWMPWVFIVSGPALFGLRIRQAQFARARRIRSRRPPVRGGSALMARMDQMLADGEISEAEHAAAIAQLRGEAPLEPR